MSTQRYSDGVDDSRINHNAQACRDNDLLASEEPLGNPAAAGPQQSGDNPKDTMGTGVTGGREAGTGEQKRQRTPLVRG